MTEQPTYALPSLEATEQFAARVAEVLPKSCLIHLHGDLGVGKTTLVRSVLQALGHDDKVKSPTFTLLETYELIGKKIHHLDLYRLIDPEELEFIGIHEILAELAIIFIEWPEQGQGVLPCPDIDCYIAMKAEERQLILKARTECGDIILANLSLRGA